MDKLNNIVLLIQHYLADYILIILLLGGGVIFTIRLGFIQIRGFKAGWKRTFGGLFSKKKERREKTVCHHFRHLQRLLQHR